MLDEFFEEALELFEEAEEALLNIEKGGSFKENYNSIYRAFHSVKGAAAMFNLQALQKHMHKIEDQFEANKQAESLSSNHVDYYLNAIDVAKNILDGDTNAIFDYSLISGKEDNEKKEENPSPSSSSPPSQAKKASDPKKKNVGLGSNDDPIVFIVDDEEDICDLLEDLLTDLKFKIFTYTDGRKALEEMNIHKPELILSDLNMPEISGLELIKEVKNREIDIPVIFISGYLSKEAVIEGLNYGVYAFIEKPFGNNIVLNSAKNAIRKYRSHKLLNRLINLVIYQFSDIEDYLIKEGKESLRDTMKEELKQIVEMKKQLKE